MSGLELHHLDEKYDSQQKIFDHSLPLMYTSELLQNYPMYPTQEHHPNPS
jgi:hypothetical protein